VSKKTVSQISISTSSVTKYILITWGVFNYFCLGVQNRLFQTYHKPDICQKKFMNETMKCTYSVNSSDTFTVLQPLNFQFINANIQRSKWHEIGLLQKWWQNQLDMLLKYDSTKFLLFKMCYPVLLKSARFWQISVEIPPLSNFMKILLLIRGMRCRNFCKFSLSACQKLLHDISRPPIIGNHWTYRTDIPKNKCNLLSNYLNSGWHTKNTLNFWLGVPDLNLSSQDSGYSDMFFFKFSFVPPLVVPQLWLLP